MCYAIPGKVVQREGAIVFVDYFGERRKALNERIDLKIGDYVYAQGGWVIQSLREEEALPILEAWRELFFELKEVDRKIAEEDPKGRINPAFQAILEKASRGEDLNREELLPLMRTEDPDELQALYHAANQRRQKYLDNACCIHGIIEFSNYCQNNCLYCGLNASSGALRRYRMTAEEILETATDAVERLGFKALVLQSGEDPYYTDEKLVEIVRGILERNPVFLSLSIGERTREGYHKLYEAGARGVLFRFETSNPHLYRRFHPEDGFEDRIDHLRFFLQEGFLIATGGLVGLPGQSPEDLLEDIFLTKSLRAEMYSFGPFIPHPRTPLGAVQKPPLDLMLKTISLMRLVDPGAKILVTTALETLDPENGRRTGLLAGANSFMLNLTPKRYKRLYEVYPGKAGMEKEIEEEIEEAMILLKELGRAPMDLGVS